MTRSSSRVVIVCNPGKQEAKAAMAPLAERLTSRVDVVGTGSIDDAGDLARLGADRVFVLGGDGSILAVVRALGEHQVPVAGVNFGKLGFLAEFGLDELEASLDAVLNDGRLVSRRMMIEATIQRNGSETSRSLAANDCVVHAGPPFRMIQLAIVVDGHELTKVSGDGVVLATPSGSTAHNMSVDGPIVDPVARAIVMSPINPHSMTHRPLVVAGDATIEVTACHVNEGTTVVIDGQEQLPIGEGDRVAVSRWPHDFQLVHHPARTQWHTLITKLKWGQ